MKRSPLQRKAFIRRFPMKRRRRSTKYSRRERDFEFMGWVRDTQLCAVLEEWPDKSIQPTECHGTIEADHMGDRGLSHKASDDTCTAMCTKHHRERTDHSGSFRTLDKQAVRAWRARQILRTQTLWREHKGEMP